jgi:hypothetical protein
MLIKKFHTLLIPLPEDLHKQLFSIYKHLSEKYANQYLDEKSWKAHITIGVLPLKDEETQKFVDICTSVLEGISKFTITFADFKLSDDQKYILLDLDQDSYKKIMEIRKKFEQETFGKFTVEIPDKYLEKWGSYSEEEKAKLRNTGSPYIYEPHISIVKFEPEIAKMAIEEIDKQVFLNKSFVVEEFHISGQSEDPDNQYPILKIVKV